MKQFAQNLGFYCQVVETDIQTLKNLSNCQVILHIPGKNHFVLLDYIDSKYVWIINLSDSKFFYRTDIDFFGMDWTEGTALLVSNQPISLQQEIAEIPDAQLQNIIGGYEGYECIYPIQSFRFKICLYNEEENKCEKYFQIYLPCWGCWYAGTGSCSYDYLVRMVQSECEKIPIQPHYCDITNEWEADYMLACYCNDEF